MSSDLRSGRAHVTASLAWTHVRLVRGGTVRTGQGIEQRHGSHLKPTHRMDMAIHSDRLCVADVLAESS